MSGKTCINAKLIAMRYRWALFALVLSCAPPAFGDSAVNMTGRWSAGVMRTAWTLSNWGDNCGPSPVGSSDVGGLVAITQHGAELTIDGLGRSYSSSSCWDQQPGVSAVSHSAGQRQWTTSCRSAASDPRRVTITTTLTASDTTIDLDEVGRYEVAIAGHDCSASVRRTRHFALIEREGEKPAAIAGGTPDKLPPTCAQTGPAVRLEASPSYKLLRPGERFTFHAKVFDEHGCPISQRVAWRLLRPLPGVDLDQAGNLSLQMDTPEGELQVGATVAEQSVQVTIYVVSAQRYAELLTSPTFNDAGESDAKATQALIPTVVGTRSPQIDPTARRRRTIFVWAVTALAVLLGVAAILVTLRRRHWVPTENPAEPEQTFLPYSASEVQTPKSVPLICPVCGTQYGPESQFCGKDGASLVPIN